MLHHINSQKEYWFCRNCWQEMPNLAYLEQNNYRQSNKPVNLSIGFAKFKQSLLVEVT